MVHDQKFPWIKTTTLFIQQILSLRQEPSVHCDFSVPTDCLITGHQLHQRLSYAQVSHYYLNLTLYCQRFGPGTSSVVSQGWSCQLVIRSCVWASLICKKDAEVYCNPDHKRGIHSHHEGKISPGWWGWGVHAHPPTPPPFITFTITSKVAV